MNTRAVSGRGILRVQLGLAGLTRLLPTQHPVGMFHRYVVKNDLDMPSGLQPESFSIPSLYNLPFELSRVSQLVSWLLFRPLAHAQPLMA